MAFMSDSAVLREVQLRLGSDVPTQTLFFPGNLGRDVVLRLEAARLIINDRGWLSGSLEPILAETMDVKAMWTPDQLEKVIRSAQTGASDPVIIADYLKDYTSLYNASTFPATGARELAYFA